jgi:hypothetical protein
VPVDLPRFQAGVPGNVYTNQPALSEPTPMRKSPPTAYFTGPPRWAKKLQDLHLAQHGQSDYDLK